MKKYAFPPELEFRYVIQPPAGKHKKFRIIKRLKAPKPGQPRSESIEDEALDSLNQSLVKGRFTKERAKQEVELIVERLYREAGVKKFKTVSNADNQRLLEAFWKEAYKKKMGSLSDPDSTYAKYRRAIEALGESSLQTADEDELQAAIDKRTSGNRQREAVNRLHTMLRWLRRNDINLVMGKEEYSEVKYLTKGELETVLLFIEDETFKLLCRVARGTGARIGELAALQTQHLTPKCQNVFIKEQVKRDGAVGPAKSKKANDPGRHAFVLPEARPLLKRWVQEKIKLTPETRLNAANIIRTASEKAFPRNNSKQVKFHDLRHSYAIELAKSGVSLLQISQQLGNSERICQKHYTGFMSTNESFDIIEAKVKAAAEIEKSNEGGPEESSG